MKALGIVRPIDALGRVVIPKSIRERWNVKPGHPIEFFATTQGVFIRPYRPGEAVPNDDTIDAVKM